MRVSSDDRLQFIELCVLLGCDYLEPTKGIGPKTALKLLRDHGSLANVVSFVRGKMAEKAEENAAIKAQGSEEEVSDHESEEGGGIGEMDGTSPTKSAKSPKKKKVTSSGMQIPEYWPFEEAKKIFLAPDVVKGDDLEVGLICGRLQTHRH